MKKFRWLLRREVAILNDDDVLTPKERIMYAISYGLKNSKSGIQRREEKREKDFLKSKEKENYLQKYLLKQINNYFYKRNNVGKIVVLIPNDYGDIALEVITKKMFSGYKLSIGYVNPVALKTLKNVRVPIVIEKVM